MQDLANRVPDDGVHHTVDVHALPDGRVRVGDNTFSAKEFADMLRRDPNFDGSTPVRLLSCDAGTSGLARDLANELGTPVTAPRGLAWTDGNGRVFASDMGPDGRPGWPPNGGWDTHHPDGTTTPASNDGFHPTRDGEDPGQRPDDAESRGQRDNNGRLSDEEKQQRKNKLPDTHHMYGDSEARGNPGHAGNPLRWDETADNGNGGWVEPPDGPLEPIPGVTPDHITGQMLDYIYGQDRPSFSASTRYTVYSRTEMNGDGSYVCSTSGERIPAQPGNPPQFYETGTDGRRNPAEPPEWFTNGEGPPPPPHDRVAGPQFYEINERGQRAATDPPDWYLNGEEPPTPPHSKFTLPEPESAHMGHDFDYEYWRQQRFGLFHEMTPEQFRAIYDNPDHYRLEAKAANEGHGHESSDPGYGRYPELARQLFPESDFKPIDVAPTDQNEVYRGSRKPGDPRRGG